MSIAKSQSAAKVVVAFGLLVAAAGRGLRRGDRRSAQELRPSCPDEGDRDQKQRQGGGRSYDKHFRKRPRLAAHGPRESVGAIASHATDDSEKRDQSLVIAPIVARARPSPMSKLAAVSQCKTSRSSRATRVHRQPRLAMLPSESSESEHDGADVVAPARRSNRRHGLASPTAHGPCSVEEAVASQCYSSSHGGNETSTRS